jgi:glutathione synthase/RimK-type ligase-like ATP-grasp enzyme
MTICVIGDTQDFSSVYVAWAARQAGHHVFELDEALLGSSWSFTCDDGSAAGGSIETDGPSARFADLVGAFARFSPEPEALPGLDLSAHELEHFRAERREALHQLLHAIPCPVANRPSTGRSNGSKPFQMRLLEAAGFSVPAWVVSNDPEEVRAFIENGGRSAIYKAVSGLRCHVRRFDDRTLGRLVRGTTPVLVQVYVPGLDVRVHVVDQACFATQIDGLGTDYRFDGSREYRECAVPPEIAELCRAVAFQEGLLLAGFDFRVDPEGMWHCLEVNPMPSFIPYEWATGQPIAEALVEAFEEQQ